MSKDTNQLTIKGRLTSDPQARGNDSMNVASMRLASSQKYGDKEKKLFISVAAFGKLAGVCMQYLRKGSPVIFTGSIFTDEWQDKEGNNRSEIKLEARDMELLPDGRERTQDNGQRDQPKDQPKKQGSWQDNW